jgi:mRNA interferase RelE/StbE
VTYLVYVEPEVHANRQSYPGHIRQRLRQAIDAFAVEPRPAASRSLDASALTLPIGVEIRRLRIDRWRVVYAVHEAEQWVWVLAIRRRPPYDYEDLADLVARIGL